MSQGTLVVEMSTWAQNSLSFFTFDDVFFFQCHSKKPVSFDLPLLSIALRNNLDVVHDKADVTTALNQQHV